MILTCPECATSYFVDDSRVPAAGRTVKCSSCGATWTAIPDEPAQPPAPPPAAATRVEAPPLDEIVVEAPAKPARTSAARRSPRPAAEGRGRAPSAAGKVAVLAAAATVIVALVAALLAFRGDVVRLWPASGAAFARLGLPTQDLGLVIEDVAAEPTFQGGRPALAITGQIRNVREAAALAPDLRVSLLDRAGKPVAAKVARPIDPRVPARAVRHFAVAIVDPPAGANDLVVSFEGLPKAAPPARAQIASQPAAPPAAAPIEAKPLPPGSPDALPQHD
jgi:predicted Zn finger-like uncharacterized protein